MVAVELLVCLAQTKQFLARIQTQIEWSGLFVFSSQVIYRQSIMVCPGIGQVGATIGDDGTE